MRPNPRDGNPADGLGRARHNMSASASAECPASRGPGSSEQEEPGTAPANKAPPEELRARPGGRRWARR